MSGIFSALGGAGSIADASQALDLAQATTALSGDPASAAIETAQGLQGAPIAGTTNAIGGSNANLAGALGTLSKQLNQNSSSSDMKVPTAQLSQTQGRANTGSAQALQALARILQQRQAQYNALMSNAQGGSANKPQFYTRSSGLLGL